MQTSDIYLIEGLGLFILSCLTMNLLFSEGSREYLNSRHNLTYKIAYLISFVFVLTWVTGLIYYLKPSTISRYLMILASEVFWISSIIVNLIIFRELWINVGARFTFKTEYVNIIFYLLTLWLLSFHIFVSYPFLALLSTVSSVVILYFTFLLKRYIGMIEVFVIPVNVYKFFISYTVVSALFSLLLLARIVEISSYLFFAISIYVFVIFVLLSLIRELRPLITKA